MFQETMLHQFSNVFIRAIKGEMDSMKQRLGSFEIPLSYTAKKNDLHELTLFNPSEKLNRGMQCSLKMETREYAVEIADIKGTCCLLSCPQNLSLSRGTTAHLVIYPWFLYEKLISGIESLQNSDNDKGLDLSFKVFGKESAQVNRLKGSLDEEQGLNQSQKEAVEFSLGSEVSFIWGPPGTGKTHTLARLLGEFLEQGKRVLVTSTTNGAVDTVIDKMIELNLAKKIRKRGEMARLGRPHGLHEEVNIDAVLNRINRDILEKIKKHQEEQNIILGRVTLLTEFMGFLEQANDQIGLFGPSDSSIREEEILRELKKSLPSYWDDFSVQKKKDYIKEAIDEKSKELALKQNQLKSHKENLIKDPKAVVNRSRLLFSTLASLYTGNMLEGELFDVVVVEEAGMAVLPALFYSLTRAKEKAVLVGDPMQLPSVVQSQNSFVKRAMGRSIYQVGLEDDFSNDTVHLLDTQYRMHPIIGDMISKLFYSGRLINGISPESRKEISSLNPAPGQPFCRIDLKGKSLCQRKEGSSSRFNQVSAEICLDLLKDIPERFTIALITPYADQSRLLNDMIRDEIKNRDHIECSTVHRFQGQERDVVILDLTDSEPLNPGMLVTGEYGRNLLNVALSRARGKLIVLSERSYFTERAPGTAIEALLKYDLT